MQDSNPNMLTDILTGLYRADKGMVKIVSQIGTRIQNRTKRGKDMNRKSFTPYSLLTKISRNKNKRSSGHVTLTYDSKMLNSIVAKRRNSNTVALFFASQEENDIAVWQHFGTNPYTITAKGNGLANKKAGLYFGKEVHHPGLPSRKFFGLSRRDRKYLADEVTKLLRKQ
jgi:hypothetical protein